MRFMFPKAEHLCLQREIDALFAPGQISHVAFPLRVVMQSLPHDGAGPQIRVLINVSKRRLRRAVDRNRAKRQIREAYRLNKHLLLAALPPNRRLHLAFLWLADQPLDTASVQKRMVSLLLYLADKQQEPQKKS